MTTMNLSEKKQPLFSDYCQFLLASFHNFTQRYFADHTEKWSHDQRVLGDKGYVSQSLQQELLETENTCLFPTRRSNQKSQYPEAFRKLQARLRRHIETTLNQLTHQFSVARVRERTHWGLQTGMSNKFGACLLGAFLNQALGRPLMKLKDLVLA